MDFLMKSVANMVDAHIISKRLLVPLIFTVTFYTSSYLEVLFRRYHYFY